MHSPTKLGAVPRQTTFPCFNDTMDARRFLKFDGDNQGVKCVRMVNMAAQQSSGDNRYPGQKFADLTRRILTKSCLDRAAHAEEAPSQRKEVGVKRDAIR